MAIEPIAFGKNLRPSTVDVMNKLNEVIASVNQLDPSNIDQIERDVSTLKTQMSTAQGNITTLQSQVSTANGNISTLTSDVDDIKITLYTPLSSTENES